MKVSYEWLKSYFKEGEAPSAEAVPDILNFHAFEVESHDALPDGDTLFDVKVLPNRAHDALSHWSIAWELGLVAGKRLDTSVFEKKVEQFSDVKSADLIDLQIEDPALVLRATKRVVTEVTVQESPEWLKRRLNAIGQRSINNIVDATNYLTHELGQPVHAFDYDKLAGSGKKQIIIRHAHAGEQVTTLDGKTFTLEPWMLVIADSEKALDIAGIKGGNNSGIDENTKRIVLSACTFDPVTIRKTSQKLGLRTDASIRFENGLTPHLAKVGMDRLSVLVAELSGGKPTEDILDIHAPFEEFRTITVTGRDVERLLGLALTDVQIEETLTRIGFGFKPGFIVEVPPTRLDLEGVADMVEEIGRTFGYENVKSVLPKALDRKPKVLKSYYYAEMIRETLLENGFSEVFLYSFGEAGERELENPLAENKGKMRVALAPALSERLTFNARNKDILGLDRVSLFEIGNVYPVAGEHAHCALATSDKKLDLAQLLPWPVENLYKGSENIVEFNLTELIKTLQDAESYDTLIPYKETSATYKPFSPFPFSARDVAVFVPLEIPESDVVAVVEKEKGPLCAVGPRLFDTFTKTFPDGTQKTSYAFRLVFQAPDRNLTGEEVQERMDAISKALGEKGWQVR